LFKLGRLEEAQTEFARAAAMTQNGRERTLLLQRAQGCGEKMKLENGN
jgi:predicted RNA polymerase sigma factor